MSERWRVGNAGHLRMIHRILVQLRSLSLVLVCFSPLIFFVPSSHAQPVLKRLPAHQIPPLVDDLDRKSLQAVLRQSMAALKHKPGTQTVAFGRKRISIDRLRDSLTAFLALLNQPGDWTATLQRDFDLYRATAPVLFTGYHEPELRGSFIRTARYHYPVYRRPTNLVEVDAAQFASRPFEEKVYGRVANGKLVPYFSRAQIDGQGILARQYKELVWLDSPIERFFLHIQGSGKIRLPDGTWFRIGYAASNGWPYRSIGKRLLKQGKLGPGEASAQAIRRYLRGHPTERDQILFHNPRYIFFRVVSEGPLGSLGVALTPGRSIATDPGWYPPGAVGFIVTKKPQLNGNEQVSWQSFSRFVSLQDRGAAITGPGRADIYWGSGPQPEAGLMAQNGDLYLFLKKL